MFLSFFIKILFAVFNVFFVKYSLAQNNLTNTSIKHDTTKKCLDNNLLKIQSESSFCAGQCIKH
jgi:hypothetical protein